MLWPWFRRLILGAFVTLQSFHHAAQWHVASALSPPVSRATLPTTFDGQYTNASASNNATEWKYFQTIADPTYGKASLAVQFYTGYAFEFTPRTSGEPEYYLDISGTFQNGTTFALILPAAFAHISANGQEVTGNWGNVACFRGQPGMPYTVTFNASDFKGVLYMEASGTQHLGCNTTKDASFSSAIPAGTELTLSEEYIYKKLLWLVSIPSGRSFVDIHVQSSPLQFPGTAYHDANAAPRPFNFAVQQWYAAIGQVGPFSYSFVQISLINSTRTLTTGYLAHDGVVLQNKCSAHGWSARDAVTVTPYGAVNDTVTNQTLPEGFVLGYILEGGEEFQFTFSTIDSVQTIQSPVLHRWVGGVNGGRVNGEKFQAPAQFELVNVPPV